MSEKKHEEVQEQEDFEVTELDDGDLEDVSGGAARFDDENNNCGCGNSNCGC